MGPHTGAGAAAFFPTVADGGVIRAIQEKMRMGSPTGPGMRRGPFDVDEERVLVALCVTWCDADADGGTA
jgi:hypothetical protein